ncbi:hypothetical protein ACFP1I_08835 [Dyadobacter subterraneus]|uniref:Uncharacterized protein n=1 Tax=Dyadobacter subterraneus TaxID=2773304 RepID=A0ABR9WE48_9BACT|nr:hypothetical protein [Dyadobacter subterraneus]MBE9463755.1 hypothetical protein [Dyadobacter subterraneus]
MVRYNSILSQVEISIPHKDFGDVSRYRKGLLRLLAEVRIDDCRPDFKDDLKAVYELLEYLTEEKMESTTRPNGV